MDESIIWLILLIMVPPCALTVIVFVLGYWLGVSQGVRQRPQFPRSVSFHLHADVHDNEVWIPLNSTDSDDQSESWQEET